MKSTATETERRVAAVADWLINGQSRAIICQNARKNWGVSDSQADRYATQARKMIRDSYASDWAEGRAMADARFEDLYRRALESNDLRLATKIVTEQVKLRGLHITQQSLKNDEAAMSCLATYATALNDIVPAPLLARVADTVRELAPPIAESLEEKIGFDYDGMMSLAAADYKRLGRGRTREELIEDGVLPV